MNNNKSLSDLSSKKNTFLYFVEKGDDLKSVADKFHTTQRVLIALNNLESEIKEGEYIIIEKLAGREYVVKPWDTFEKIAHNDKEQARELALKNKTELLYVGQKIYI